MNGGRGLRSRIEVWLYRQIRPLPRPDEVGSRGRDPAGPRPGWPVALRYAASRTVAAPSGSRRTRKVKALAPEEVHPGEAHCLALLAGCQDGETGRGSRP